MSYNHREIELFFVNSLCFLSSGILILFPNISCHKQGKISKNIKNNLIESLSYLKNSTPELKRSLSFIIIINFSVAPMSLIMTLLADKSNFGSEC